MATYEHGTYQRYIKDRCRCAECRRAWADYWQASKLRRHAALVEDPTIVGHGLASTYGNYGCRCRDCTDAHATDVRARRGVGPVNQWNDERRT